MNIEMLLEDLKMGKKIDKLEEKILKLEEKNNKHIPKNEKQEKQKKQLEDVIYVIKKDIKILKSLNERDTPENKEKIKSILSDRKKVIKAFTGNNILKYIKAIGAPVLTGLIFGGLNYLLNMKQLNTEGGGVFIVPRSMRFTNINSFSKEELKDFLKKAAIVNGTIPSILSSAVVVRKHIDKKDIEKNISNTAKIYKKREETVTESYFNY